MGQQSSRHVRFEPEDDPKVLQDLEFWMRDAYGLRENELRALSIDPSDPMSLENELKRWDMAGIIIFSRRIPQWKDTFYIVGEDDIDTSIVKEGYTYSPIYPKHYKGLVPYYIGGKNLEWGEFLRPARKANVDQHQTLDSTS
ncbi:hypothetical protein Dda_6431 [Drechslerella dactyloides]|uniref:Uncharacterized protein n=1 Tax=Drechslerella dactyloides TaxID=74499 RepID=A0AAD6IX83_DREDA|nr:hypothetical protein Dda_6431 [Drechslerella dactyloides]